MAVNLLLHPVVGALAVALLLAAFTAKARARKFYRLHYALGLSTLAAASVAFALGLVTTVAALGEGVEFEETAVFHLGIAGMLLLALVAQARWGLAMWRRRLQAVLLPRHRSLARILLLLSAVLAGLGAITFVTIR